MPSERSLLTVDLAALRANVARFRSRLAPATSLCAVVKADAYGHGALEVGRAAVEAGAAGLAVVTSGEALELREGGYRGALLVMGPVFEVDEARTLASRDVDLTVTGVENAELLVGAFASGVRARVHIKIDSGMFRQGIPPARLTETIDRLASVAGLQVVGAMTHLACADEDPECVGEQLREFRPAAAQVRERWPAVRVHAANSAATLRHAEAHFDMVRCGIGLYGLSPFQTDPAADGLLPVLSWTSIVAAIKELPRGRGAGYGHTFRPSEGTLVGLVPLGYADGVRRSLGNRGSVLVRGRRYPMAGRVSMDSFLIDLGPATDVRPGDRVVLVGEQGGDRLLMEEPARLLGTINYEVACGISLRRAARRFVS
jgi:alanine racemase